MTAVPALLPPSPLSEDKAPLLAQLTDGLDGAALWWLSGYTAGLASRHGTPNLAVVPAAEAPNVTPLTVVYGSQTGNARRLAEKLAEQIEAAGLPVRLLRADLYPLRELKNERYLHVVISTQGDGDPPDDARAFVEFLFGKRAPALPELKFAVLGLGDSSYPKFCEISRRLDARLAELGATRWLPRGDVDLDIEAVANPWVANALDLARQTLKPSAPPANVTALRRAPSAPAWTREQPFAAELLVNQRITGRGSSKDIRHLEISLEGSGLAYEPGDALGVWPRNPPALVAEVLRSLKLDADAEVTHAGHTLPLHTWLTEKRELTRLLQLPTARSALELVTTLRPLTPRLYSIASSQKAVGEEAHLTVAHVEYQRDGATRWGAASHFLATREDGDRLPVYIERNERFHLPRDGARDLIMIGPGTGVAPYRGFLQDRVATGASGRHWLLFGNPHSRSDFLYQLEWQRALKNGQLHRLDLAFSRDTSEKTYVQQRLRENGRELYAWLQDGAHLYVCGDALRMARDVQATLLEVIAEHGDKDAEQAQDYLNELQRQGRYARDIY